MNMNKIRFLIGVGLMLLLISFIIEIYILFCYNNVKFSYIKTHPIENIELNNNGYIKVDDKQMTSLENVFAAGDLIGTKSTVSWAARSGRDAAEKIIHYFL